MIFIVDTNIVFSALLRDSITRQLLIDSQFSLYSPETMINEIRKYEKLILEKSGLEKNDFEALFSLIVENIKVIEKSFYSDKMDEAFGLIGHIDKGDVPFIALALSTPNNGIWTDNIKHFRKQNKIKIYTTEDVINEFY